MVYGTMGVSGDVALKSRIWPGLPSLQFHKIRGCYINEQVCVLV